MKKYNEKYNLKENEKLLHDLRKLRAPRWIIKKAQKLYYSETEFAMSPFICPHKTLEDDIKIAHLSDIINTNDYIDPYL